MIKNIKSLGTLLSKKEQKLLTGGCGTSKCEPWDEDGGGGQYIVCEMNYGTEIHPYYHYIKHYSCDYSLCYGGTVHIANC